MLLPCLTIAAAAMFAGTATYVSLVEQPARMALDDQGLLEEWKPSYKRGALMQAPLALIAFALGVLTWRTCGGDWRWVAGALLAIAAWPFTLVVIRPVNDRLLATSPDAAGPESRTLMVRWARLHAVRTALGIASLAAFLWAASALP